MGPPRIRSVAFDCFGTLLHIGAPTNPWRSILKEARRHHAARMLDPRREPIQTIEEFAEACGLRFQTEWRDDLDREIGSIELFPEAPAVLSALRAAGFRIALASNLAPPYIEPALMLLRSYIDTNCFSCDAQIRAVKPEAAFFAALRGKLGLPANQILMVGDSLASDIHGAQAVGMAALHLVPGVTSPRRGEIRCLTDVARFLSMNQTDPS